MSHKCPVPACGVQVPTSRLACPRHWFMVPKDLRDEVWAAYKEEPHSDRHMAAVSDTISFLSTK